MPIRLRGAYSFTREHTAVILLLFNSFFWYFVGQSIVGELASAFKDNLGLPTMNSRILEATFPFSILISSLIGSILLSKIQERHALFIWLFFGTLTSFLPIISIGDSFVGSFLIIIILGISFGLGMPLLLKYFTESFPIENRGKIGGLTFLLVTISAPLFIMASKYALSDLMLRVIFFGAWRFWSIPIVFFFFNHASISESVRISKRCISFSSIFQNRSFILYFIAWLMFSMVDAFEPLAISPDLEKYRDPMNIIEPVVAGATALIAGILADRTGRKRVIIFGFVSLGVAYAILGLAPHDISWYFYFVADGLAIGALWSIFTIVIWGELTKHGVEKYYAIGEAPLFLAQILYLFLPSVGEDFLAFSLAAFFLFIAVIPLLNAPETLPEKKIQQRQLRIYTEEALKLKQKVEEH